MSLAGAKMCGAHKPCERAWTYSLGNRALGEELEAEHGWHRPLCWGAPWAVGGEHRRGEGGGQLAACVETGAAWSRQGVMRMTQEKVKDGGEERGGEGREG